MALNGRGTIATEGLQRAIAGLSALMNTRAARETLEAWLALPPIAKRFSLTTEELGLLGDWLEAARVSRRALGRALAYLGPTGFCV